MLAQPLRCDATPGFEECRGAACCAWVALGRYASLDDAVAAAPPPALLTTPSDAGVAAMDELYERFTHAYERGAARL
jgi:sugar (pentulose or hexulose) kinase